MQRHSTLWQGVGLLVATVIGLACRTAEPEPEPTDRTLGTLDRLISSGRAPRSSRSLDDLKACIARIDTSGLCLPDEQPPRVLNVRVALDPRYTTKWPDWRGRLKATLDCVNRLYLATGIRWRFSRIMIWPPGEARHQLYALLARLQRDFPPDDNSVVLGITVWDERKIYGLAGGEIGLSQRGACVVPSWPRVENDCVILAHELGHLVRARHVPGKHWIMGWAARPFFLPARDPLARVAAVYTFHPLNAAIIAAHRTAHYTPWGIRAVGSCARRLNGIRACWNDSSR